MSNFSILFALLIFSSASQGFSQQIKVDPSRDYQRIENPNYILEKPIGETNAVIILFGGFPQLAEDIEREFDILPMAKAKNVAVLYSNVNGKLWLEENVKELLAVHLQEIFEENQLPTDTICLGGFSSGGVLAMLIGDYLIAHKKYGIEPSGVFLVDSPVDLAALYRTSEKNIERNFSEGSVEESEWLLDLLGTNLGNPHEDLSEYERLSVFTSQSGNINNLKHLKKTKIRLYTEPDTVWWKENRRVKYDEMNAFYIKILSEKLEERGFEKVEYIPTQNKGFRANGSRHPHSWSIVEPQGLINWVLK